MADTSLLFNIIGKDRTGPAFRSAADGASKLGTNLKRGLMAGAAALGTATIAGAVLGKQMIDIASDTNEALSKTNVVFGKSADEVIKFAETSATQFGISKKDALGFASAMGSVATAMGVPRAEASKLSLSYTKLSADLASFNNTSVEEAADALRASVSGEFEQLKKFGIVVNDVTLAQEAQRLGMKKAGATWSQDQKLKLSNAIITRAAADAQGDFARTSDGLANRQKILSARLEDLKGKLGEKLLPVAVAVTGALIRLTDWVEALGTKMGPVKSAGQGVSSWLRSDFMPVARRFGTWLKNEAIPAVREFAQKLWRDLQPTIKQLSATIRQDIVPAVKMFIQKFREAWPTIKRVLNILGDIASFILRRVVPVLIQFYGKYLSTLIRVFGQAFSAGWRFIGVFINIVNGARNAGSKVVNFFKNLPGNIVSAIGDVSGKLVQKGRDFISGFGRGVEEQARSLPFGVGKVIGWAIDGVAKAQDSHSPSRVMMKYGRWFVEGFAIGMKDKTNDVVDKAQALVDKLKEKLDAVKDFARQIKDTFASFADVTSIDTLITGDNGDTEGGFAKLLADLRGRAAGAKAFDTTLAQLRKLGLNETTLGQLRDSGPDQGLKSAQQILGAGAGGVGQVNSAVRAILASGSSLGNREAKALYGIDPSKSQKLQMKITGGIKVSADVNSFIKVLRQEIRAQGGDVQKVLGKSK